jgi:hypothetical protein
MNKNQTIDNNQTMDSKFINELHELLVKYYPSGDPEIYSKWSKDYSDEVEIKIYCYPKLKEQD